MSSKIADSCSSSSHAKLIRQRTIVDEFPEESDRWSWVDVLEGSAQYVEAVSLALAERGCAATEAELAAAIAPHQVHHRPG